MGTRRRILIAAAAVAVLLLLGWFLLADRGPVYHGKSVKAWVNAELYRDDPYAQPSWDGSPVPGPGSTMSYVAKNKMFPQLLAEHPDWVVPYLIRALKTRETAAGQKYERLYNRLPSAFSKHLPKHYHAWTVHTTATVILCSMGPAAKDALPTLCESLTNSPGEFPDFWTIYAIVSIGPHEESDAPMFIGILQNSTDNYVQAMAMQELGVLHADAQEVVPILVRELRNPDEFARMYAFRALEAFGPDAKPAEPVLREIMSSANTPDADEARHVLIKIDSAIAAQEAAK